MRHVKLANGTVYNVSRCGVLHNSLHICVTGENLLDLVLVFGHPENVITIEHYFDGTETDHVFFKGYTALVTATTIDEGVLLMLEKR